MIENIKSLIQSSIDVKKEIINNDETIKALTEVVNSINITVENNNFIFFCGNGGSAADAQHISAELTGRFKAERRPLKSLVLGSNFSSLTAIANDYSYDKIFSRELLGLGSKNDLLIAYSTSGNSKNIVNTINTAKKIGLKSIIFTGKQGGSAKEIADIAICVPSDDTARIQESHITLSHIMLEIFEKSFFKL
jgi:D-sedoheptulose 7-phosphate isomerase